MQLMVLVVNKEELVDQVLAAYLELGITGATVLDSVGMARIVAEHIPIFAGLRHLVDSERAYNKTIFSVIDEQAVPLDDVIALVEEVIGDLSQPGTGILFTVPVTRVKGFTTEFEG